MGSRVPADLSSAPVRSSDHPDTVDIPADLDEQVDDQARGSSSETSADGGEPDIRKRKAAVAAAASVG